MTLMKVRYKGAADNRILPAKDLKPHGVSVDKDLEFNAGNRWSMSLDVTENLEKVLRADGAFAITQIKDDGSEGATEADATVQDDTADTVVMADTGQVDKSDEQKRREATK